VSGRQSIQPTYDATKTGDRFTLETRLNGRRLSQEKMPDPFVNTTVHVGWWDRLRCLFGGLSVNVIVSGDREICEDVLELNADYLGPRDSTRRRGMGRRVATRLGLLGRRVPSNRGAFRMTTHTELTAEHAP
jgi:hypothetical protein